MSASVNWNWPGEISVGMPNVVQLVKGKKMPVLPSTMKDAPITLVNSNCTGPLLFSKTARSGGVPSNVPLLEANIVSET